LLYVDTTIRDIYCHGHHGRHGSCTNEEQAHYYQQCVNAASQSATAANQSVSAAAQIFHVYEQADAAGEQIRRQLKSDLDAERERCRRLENDVNQQRVEIAQLYDQSQLTNPDDDKELSRAIANNVAKSSQQVILHYKNEAARARGESVKENETADGLPAKTIAEILLESAKNEYLLDLREKELPDHEMQNVITDLSGKNVRWQSDNHSLRALNEEQCRALDEERKKVKELTEENTNLRAAMEDTANNENNLQSRRARRPRNNNRSKLSITAKSGA
jgi:hypothetical protein